MLMLLFYLFAIVKVGSVLKTRLLLLSTSQIIYMLLASEDIKQKQNRVFLLSLLSRSGIRGL